MASLCPKTASISTAALVMSLLLYGHGISAKNIDINLSGDGCDNPSGYYVGNDDIASVFHRGSFDLISTRDDCYVTLRTDQRRRLEYVIENARFQQCGITITISDALNVENAKHVINCDTDNKIPIKEITNYNVMRLHLRKANVDTYNFEFSMRVINDREKQQLHSTDDAVVDGRNDSPGVWRNPFVANVQSACTSEDILACSEGYLDIVNSNPSTKDLCRATRTILDCLYDEMAQCPAEVKTTFETNAQTYLDVAENELDKHCGAGLTSFNLWVLMVVAIFGVTRHFP